MDTRFIQPWQDGEKVYMPGDDADWMTKNARAKLIKAGIVVELAKKPKDGGANEAPEVEDEQ